MYVQVNTRQIFDAIIKDAAKFDNVKYIYLRINEAEVRFRFHINCLPDQGSQITDRVSFLGRMV